MKSLLWCLVMCWMSLALPAVAQDEPADEAESADSAEGAEGEEGDESGVSMPNSGAIYIPLKPAFVVNYGGAGPLRYLKTDISVRVANAKAANAVRHHLPYIRNNLVMLFSAQTDETLKSQVGRDALRKEALQEVKDIIKREDDLEGIIDLYFNSFIVQR